MQQSPCLEACPSPPEYSWMTRLVSVFTFYLHFILVEFCAFFVGVSTVWGGDCTGWYIHSSHWQADPLAAQPLEDIKMERRQRHTHRQVLTYDGSYNTHTHTNRRARARNKLIVWDTYAIMSYLPPLLFQPFLRSLYISLWRNWRPTRCAIKVV